MRFSLKWILAAVVYVAIAAAAFSQESWVYADILWAVSMLAIVFAALKAFLARDRGRVAAAGFLLASLCYLTCLAFGQLAGVDVVATKRLLIASGYDPNPPMIWSSGRPVPTAVYGSSGPNTLTWQSAPAAPAVYAPSTVTLSSSPQPIFAVPTPVAVVADFAMYVRAANAVGMMLFGGLGVVVGLLALKRVSPPNPGV